MPDRKKLIEVSLPLEEINKQSAREKSIRHGHPSTLHLWWARRPLASCRAVLFASLVDDPSARPEEFPTEEAQATERKRLLELIEKLVAWENVNNQALLAEAQAEILKSTNGNPPPVLDPFCGGGSIPLEVQRLGLEAHASDINPVAVLITKALIEIPPKFKDLPPVNPEAQKQLKANQWFGAQGLAEDVRYYGKWIRDEAEKRIGHLYPKVKLPKELGEGEATVIAWLWARTVKCPNPTCGCQMPLLSSFVLSSKKGKEAYLVPEVSGQEVKFSISNKPPQRYEDPKKGFKRGTSGIFECAFCETVTTRDYVSEQAKAKFLGIVPTAVVVQAKRGRLYLPAYFAPCPEIPKVDTTDLAIEFAPNPRDLWCRNFGLYTPADLFTPRQLVALTTLSDLVKEAHKQICHDINQAREASSEKNSTDSAVYADAVTTYLGLALSKLSDSLCALATWSPSTDQAIHAFTKQAIPMVWDYAESNTFNNAAGDYITTIKTVVRAINNLGKGLPGYAHQQDATKYVRDTSVPALVFTTDPPYYDNISYAELSDFFYVWLRRSLEDIYPTLFSTIATPKEQELVAAPYRFGGDKEKARQFFEDGLHEAFRRTYEASHPDYPFTVFYAFKQTEVKKDSANALRIAASTGWETMLESLIQSGFSVTGTWPMRTERDNRIVGQGKNALASSIALVCRPLPTNAAKTTRRDFLTALKRELPAALRAMQQGNIAPVDLAQASIGPGMAVFSRYKQVLESDGSPMRVRTALQLINQTLDEYLTEQEGELDADTRWALTWFEQHQFEDGNFGDAETLSKAKVTSIQGLVTAGILTAKYGKVRLLHRDDLPAQWNPIGDTRIPDWEATQHLIKTLQERGEHQAAFLLNQLDPDRAEIYRDLAYRLYNICDRKSWTQEAIAYNSLVISWAEITRLAAQSASTQQIELLPI
ncbi:DUF1156 domain-containing protein [Leptolyngbya sp. NIES-2104]|uniref:DUF1156 domain-containing protein n=1 Tax=Leptolyngbya sp. NIES-2104 TaxID=1552121 RepID=UPI0006EC65D4|nr:DUF1156 domain-containing protein [Leptolyngbya sp. NIES-2104]GAP99078.1 adenine-specific DNA methylase containing a Zn-ribbon [Leptolyngbya sp. NIES-2104]